MTTRRLLTTLACLSLSAAGIGCQTIETARSPISSQDAYLPTGYAQVQVGGDDLGCSTVGSCGEHGVCGDCKSCGECMNCEPLIIFVGADRDVFKVGKFPDLANQFRRRGYNAVYFDPLEHRDDARLLADWVRSNVRCRGRRVMLVGWSIGAVVCIDALEQLKHEGICVDTFVDLDCYFLNRHAGERNLASNTGRTVVIRSKLNRKPRGYCNACLYRLDTLWHMKAPTCDQTRWILTQEANRLRAPVALNAVPDVPPATD